MTRHTLLQFDAKKNAIRIHTFIYVPIFMTWHDLLLRTVMLSTPQNPQRTKAQLAVSKSARCMLMSSPLPA